MQIGRIGIFTCAALMAFGVAGCVTETIPPPEIHTTAYVTADEPDAPSADAHPFSNDAAVTADAAPQNAPTSSANAVPARSQPAPPIPALAPPPVIH
jgi:hypothetical protein